MPAKRPDIVVIAVDTLRPDHLGCYGYPRPTSPAVDRLAEQSVVFDQAFAAGIPTTPAFTTLLSGLHPYHHQVVSHPGGHPLDAKIQLLSQLAKAGGYLTVACDNLVVQGAGRGTWFARGYDHYSGFLYAPFGDQSRQLTDRALSFVQGAREEPLFLFIHYWDPHTPYGPLPPYDTLHYEPGSGPVEMSEVRAIHPDYYDAFVADMKLRHPDDYAYIVAQYDGEITQVDTQVGRLLDGLRASRGWDDTVVLLVSDHGECFGEGGLYFDHHGLYDAVIRTTMMLRTPSGERGRCDALVSHEDVLPTLCELANLELPPYPLTGRSVLPLLSGSARSIRPYVVSTESTRQASVAWRTATEKLIVPVTHDAGGEPLPDLYGRPRRPDPLLFDLTADPGERQDLAAEEPQRVARLRAELDAWTADTLAVAGQPDPIATQGLSLPYDRFMERVLHRLAPEAAKGTPPTDASPH
ncbi:sulfatase [Actinopolymorpha alba]|uniref:sulfatase family protein n=1 Tax=Actinopolymorpha alba TaxID=533267 RepID=UPI000362CE31|nr:sulfatase [Actinopolymorpha alba]